MKLWNGIRGFWARFGDLADQEIISAQKAREAAMWSAAHSPGRAIENSAPPPPSGQWIGTVLAALGDHIRRLEDENRELRERLRIDDPDRADHHAVEHALDEGLLDRDRAGRGESNREGGGHGT